MNENVKKLKDAFDKKTLIYIGIAVIAAIILFGVWLFLKEQSNSKEVYTIEEVNQTLVFDGKGVVKNENDATYNLKESATVANISYTTKKVGDKVTTSDALISYTESSYSDIETVTKFPDNAGYVMDINDVDNEVLVRTQMAFNVSSSYEPNAGDCAIIVATDTATATDYIFNAEVIDTFTISGRGTTISLDVIDNGKALPETYNTKVYFENSVRSNMYSCDTFEFFGGLITVPGQGSSEPTYTETSNGVFTETTETYDNSFNSPGAKYEYVGEKRGDFSVEDYLETTDPLYLFDYKKLIENDKTIKPTFDGIIKSIDSKDDDSEVTVVVYDNSKNYLEIELDEEDKDKVSKDMKIIISRGDIMITTKINDIKGNLVEVVNSNLLQNNLGDEYDAHIEVDEGTVLLIPVEYVKDGKVKKELDGEFKEIAIEYEEYSAEKYKIISGLEASDKVEKY